MLPSASSLAKAIARTTSQSALRLAVGISGRPNSIVQPATVLGRQLYSRYPASHTALGRSVHATLLKQPFGGQSAGMAAADSTVLSASQDTFDGIIIDAELLPHSEGEFYALLRRSLEVSEALSSFYSSTACLLSQFWWPCDVAPGSRGKSHHDGPASLCLKSP